jgi:hypothetical protein
MMAISEHHERTSSKRHSGDKTGPDSRLDYETSLQALLADVDMTEKELEELPNSVEASKGPAGDHLSFEEARDYESLASPRQEHVDSCEYCAGLIECFLSTEEVAQLARQAAHTAGARTPVQWRTVLRLAGLAVAIMAVSIYSAFIVGRASAGLGVEHAEMARHIDELGMLRTEGADPASRFRAARLYADLNLKAEADNEFLAALERQNVKQDEIERFRSISAEANGISFFGRWFAGLLTSISRSCDGVTSADACLSYTELEFRAGRWSDAYKSFLLYLALINERPAGAERFDETLTVAASRVESARRR